MPLLSLGASEASLLALSFALPRRYPFYLTSCGAGWDVLFSFPEEVEVFDDSATLATYSQKLHGALPQDHAAPWPFSGGWFVYLSYDLAAVNKRTTEPLGLIAKVPAAILRKGKELFFAYEAGYASLEKAVLQDLKNLPRLPDIAPPLRVCFEEEPAEDFLKGVLKVQEAIARGETYQVNLARQWQAYLDQAVLPHLLFQNLNTINPAPFSALVTIPGTPYSLLSASPERLVHVKQGTIETQPIAGTRPRLLGKEKEVCQALLAHPKERSEHIMLVDLARNDVAQVSTPGSVQVSSLLDVTTYAYVHHLESTIKARLDDGVGAGDIITALFPGGTITGCPKKHTMSLIEQIEKTPRGAYTGSVGYISRDGQMDLNILIRTLVMRDTHITFKTGAGIVADSNPTFELEETRAKAQGLMLALEQRI